MKEHAYPIRAVSKLTGLTVDTLRAWERRYEAIKPSRAGRGRVYSEADIRRLNLLRQAVEAGHAIGQVASLSDQRLAQLGGRVAELTPLQVRAREDAAHVGGLLGARRLVGKHDRERVDEVLGRARGGAARGRELVSGLEAQEGKLRPALTEPDTVAVGEYLFRNALFVSALLKSVFA